MVSKGKSIFYSTIWGVVIIYGSFLITGFIIKNFAPKSDVAQGWFSLQCDPSKNQFVVPTGPPAGTGGTGGTGGTVTTAFNNTLSDDLVAFMGCMQDKGFGGSGISSTTDGNIAAGKCDPLSSDSSMFSNPARCSHAQYSCHYGGRTCQAKGSYALDFGDETKFTAIQKAAQECQPGAYVHVDGNADGGGGQHVHVSIGGAKGCGCN